MCPSVFRGVNWRNGFGAKLDRLHFAKGSGTITDRRIPPSDDMASEQIKKRASLLQSKIQKPVRFEISKGMRASVAEWMEDPPMVGSEFLWRGRFHARLYILIRQYARTLRDPFNASDESHPNRQENRQPARSAAAAGTYQDG